jgi:hypothetical protein
MDKHIGSDRGKYFLKILLFFFPKKKSMLRMLPGQRGSAEQETATHCQAPVASPERRAARCHAGWRVVCASRTI